MGLLKSFFSQCARPQGSLGRAMLCFMNYTHAPLTRWGLNLVDVQDGWTMLDIGCGGGFTIRHHYRRESIRRKKMADKIKTSYKFSKSFYVEGAMLYFRARKR